VRCFPINVFFLGEESTDEFGAELTNDISANVELLFCMMPREAKYLCNFDL
jgi:hypothetical protein